MKIDKLFFLVMENITPEKIFQQQNRNEKIKRKKKQYEQNKKESKKIALDEERRLCWK